MQIKRGEFRKSDPSRGSHLPVLIKLVRITPGSIAELGCGMYSTPFLHWACYSTKRRLVTYESKVDYFDFADQFKSDYHEIVHVEDWDILDFSEPWSIAFLDHFPDERRYLDIPKFVHADYMVAHDADNSSDKKYNYIKTHNLFSSRFKYSDTQPKTLIMSNRFDVSRFTVF